MSDRDRLIELIKYAEDNPEKTCPHYLEADCFACPYDKGEGCDHVAREADYLLANGVILLPCKVGDVVYWIDNEKIKQGEVFEISIHIDGILVHTGTQYCLEIEQVFLTREEAKAKLKELGKE